MFVFENLIIFKWHIQFYPRIFQYFNSVIKHIAEL